MSRACFFPFFASKGTALALSKPKETKSEWMLGEAGAMSQMFGDTYAG